MKKKNVLLMLILIIIPITKVYGDGVDDYACDDPNYEVVSDSNGYYCCPKGFSYGYLDAGRLKGKGKYVCYYFQDLEKEEEHDCKFDTIPLLDNSDRCYIDSSKPKLKSENNESYGCFSCKNYKKYVYSNKTPSSDDCPTEWEILNIDEKSCKEKEKNISSNESKSEKGVYMVLQCPGTDGSPFFPTYFTDNSGNSYKTILTSIYLSNKLCPRCWLNKSAGLDGSCKLKENLYDEENGKMFELGICPENYRDANNGKMVVVPYGKVNPVRTAKLDNDKFIIYSYTYKKETRIIVEAYTVKGALKGRYGYIGGNLVNFKDDEILYQQLEIFKYLYETDGSFDFFNIDNKFATLQIAGKGNKDSDIAVCKNLTLDECKKNKDFKILLISGDGINLNAQNVTISKKVNDFFTSSGQNGISEIVAVFENNKPNEDVLKDEKFIAACKELNEKMNKTGTYKVDNYSLDDMISNLEYATKLIDELYDKSDIVFNGKTLGTAAAEWIMNETTGTKELLDLRVKEGKEYSLNANNKSNVVYTSFISLINEALNGNFTTDLHGVNLISLQDDLDKFGSLFYETVNNLLSGQIQLSISQEDKLREMQKKLDIIAEERDYTFTVTNCEGLLSQNIIDKLNSYLKIVKYAVPILLIVFGIFDFSKAVLSPNEDEMKKSQKTFIKRLAVALLFFFVPTIVNLILTLANKVWPIIIPNSCETRINKD